ncbi:hypothetical protein BC828DRAFT_385196 [Blastocladiella britannica]|nr:hypothetical protein BC828DRAFT_385196 [Blastocladiella britannica]
MSSLVLSPTSTTTSRFKALSIASSAPYKVRDFAHPPSSPLHYGIYPVTSPAPSTTSDIDNLFPCHARAMYDFDAQDPTELSFVEGQLIYVHERKYPGYSLVKFGSNGQRIDTKLWNRWLLGTVNDVQGLVPENYVCIEDDMSDSDDTSRPPSSLSGTGTAGSASGPPGNSSGTRESGLLPPLLPEGDDMPAIGYRTTTHPVYGEDRRSTSSSGSSSSSNVVAPGGAPIELMMAHAAATNRTSSSSMAPRHPTPDANFVFPDPAAAAAGMDAAVAPRGARVVAAECADIEMASRERSASARSSSGSSTDAAVTLLLDD